MGCGSGALSIRAALTWQESAVTGIDYWGAVYYYSQSLCEKNAASEGVGSRCMFRRGDACKLDFPDESFDAVVSNYVYHNITGADKQGLLLETLRVLKKSGVFAINDEMKPRMYGDMEVFAQRLRDMVKGFLLAAVLLIAVEVEWQSRHSLRQNTDAGIHRRHLHRGAFIHSLSSCASPEEKAVSAACSTVLGLISGTEKPGKETHLESPSFLKLDIRKAPTFR